MLLNVFFLNPWVCHEILIVNWRCHITLGERFLLVEIGTMQNFIRVQSQSWWWNICIVLLFSLFMTNMCHNVIILVFRMVRDWTWVILRRREISNCVYAITDACGETIWWTTVVWSLDERVMWMINSASCLKWRLCLRNSLWTWSSILYSIQVHLSLQCHHSYFEFATSLLESNNLTC